jgi:hypothetical protein
MTCPPLCRVKECGSAVDFQIMVDGKSEYCRDHAEAVVWTGDGDGERTIDWQPRRAGIGVVSFVLSIGSTGDMVEKYGFLANVATADGVLKAAQYSSECIPVQIDEDAHQEAVMRIAQASLLGWELVSTSESNTRVYLWFRPERKR